MRAYLILNLHTYFALDYYIAVVQRNSRLRSGLAAICIENLLIDIFLYGEQSVGEYYPYLTDEDLRYRHMFDNCSWFHWKSVTQLEGESVFFESLSCSVLTEHAFLAHYFAVMLFQHLQFCCQRLWKSLALFSLFHSTGPEWLFKVWGGRLRGRRKVLSVEARCTFWAVREHMRLSLWLLVLVRLMNKTEAFAFFFLAYFSTELIRLHLLWSSAFKEGLILLSGGNKKAKVSLRTLKWYLFFFCRK